MDRDSADATRLRVNRISLIQQIDTRELIPKLIRTHIISADHDVQYINQGTSRIDRARRLIDCLLGEENENVNRPVNWYLLFRSILLENPSVYTDLVRALDTTKIQTPDVSNCKSSQVFTDQPNSSQSDEHQESNKQDSFDQTEEQRMNNSKIINNIQNQIKN
ncbi:unnamed protein product, partial [Rotaria magnacalcarata]